MGQGAGCERHGGELESRRVTAVPGGPRSGLCPHPALGCSVP